MFMKQHEFPFFHSTPTRLTAMGRALVPLFIHWNGALWSPCRSERQPSSPMATRWLPSSCLM